jgi:hypothetical protein
MGKVDDFYPAKAQLHHLIEVWKLQVDILNLNANSKIQGVFFCLLGSATLVPYLLFSNPPACQILYCSVIMATRFGSISKQNLLVELYVDPVCSWPNSQEVADERATVRVCNTPVRKAYM